jgi:CDP-glycerol glycerophosphotransferase (TagB/SpsB family)
MEKLNIDRLNSSIYKIIINKYGQIEITGHAFITGASIEHPKKYKVAITLCEVETGHIIKLKHKSLKLEFLKDEFYDQLDYRYAGFVAKTKLPYYLLKSGNYEITANLIADENQLIAPLEYTRIENFGTFTSQLRKFNSNFQVKLVENKHVDMKIKSVIKIKKDIEKVEYIVNPNKVSSKFREILEQEAYQKSNLWLFTERESQAQDNGKVLFEYVIDNHPEINARYAITLDGFDLFDEKYQKYLVEYRSLEHLKMYTQAKYKITTHPGYDNPFKHENDNNVETYLFDTVVAPKLKHTKLIFLQHGPTLTKTQFITSAYSKIKENVHKIITSYEFEEKNLIENFNYRKRDFIESGLARWDNLTNENTKENIFLFFHWRKELADDCDKFDWKNAINSDFMKNAIKLIDQFEKQKIKTTLKFHNQFEGSILNELIEYFKDYEYVKYEASNQFTKIIQESKLLITDKSSITSEFLYLEKPIIKYFDSQTDFDANNNIPVTNDVEQIIKLIKEERKTTNPFYKKPHCAKIVEQLQKEQND